MVQKTVGARDEFATKEEYQNEIADMREKADEVKQHLMDSNMVLKKGTDSMVVKNFNIIHHLEIEKFDKI